MTKQWCADPSTLPVFSQNQAPCVLYWRKDTESILSMQQGGVNWVINTFFDIAVVWCCICPYIYTSNKNRKSYGNESGRVGK